MSSGPAHFRAAEELLVDAVNGQQAGCGQLLTAALAHAVLALTAATALPLVTAPEREFEEGPIVPDPAREWEDVIL